MEYRIRRATVEDSEFVLALFAKAHVSNHLHPLTRDDFIRSIQREGFENLIVERGEQRYGNLLIDVEAKWLLSIRSLAIWEQGRGAGRFAMEWAIRYGFEELGVHRIFLEVLEANVAARALYERVGFHAEGCYRDGYRDESGFFHNLIPYGMLASDRRR